MLSDTYLINKFKNIFIFVPFIFLFIIFNQPVFAKRCVVLTYDISASMYYLSKKGDRIAFLAAGEFERLAKSVADQILYGNAFYTSKDVMITNDDDMGPYWREGDGFHYIEYGETIKPKIGYDGGESLTKENLRQRLMDVIAYPRNIASGSKNLKKSHIRKAFDDAFPDSASLQNLSEVSAWEIFDREIKTGDDNAEVIWIRVSDEDRDHTTIKGGRDYKVDENKLEKDRQTFIRKYKNCIPVPIFQIKYCDRIWVTASLMKFFDVSELETSLEEAQKKADKYRSEADQLREQAEQSQQSSQKQLEEIQNAKDQARIAAETARNLELQKQELQQQIEAAKNKINMASKDIYLHVIGNNDTSSQKVQFARKWIGEHDRDSKKPFICNKLILKNGKNSIASDFQIDAVEFDIRDRHGTSIFHSDEDNIIDKHIEIGKPFTIAIPYMDRIADEGCSIFVNVSYQYLNKNIDGSTYKKNWIVKATFPGTGGLFFVMVLLILLIVGIIIVWFIMGSQEQKNFEEQKDNDEPLWHDDDSTMQSYRDDMDYGSTENNSSYDSSTTITFIVKGKGQKELCVENDETIYLSLPDDSRAQYIDINSSDTIKWQNGMIMHNGIPITKNKMIIKDNLGRKQVVSWKIH